MERKPLTDDREPMSLLGKFRKLYGSDRTLLTGTIRQSSFSMPGASIKSEVLSDELEKESQKVRSMYEIDNRMSWVNGRLSGTENQSGVIEVSVSDESEL